MSKAFTKDDAEPTAAPEPDPAELVPAGAVNYLTPEGHAAFAAELEGLNQRAERGPAEDRRRRWLARVLEISVPFAPDAKVAGGRARFGSTVTYRAVTDADDGASRVVTLVGIHEADPANLRVSWNSPLARALLGAAPGDVRRLRTNRGDDELEVLSVEPA